MIRNQLDFISWFHKHKYNIMPYYLWFKLATHLENNIMMILIINIANLDKLQYLNSKIIHEPKYYNVFLYAGLIHECYENWPDTKLVFRYVLLLLISTTKILNSFKQINIHVGHNQGQIIFIFNTFPYLITALYLQHILQLI